MDTSLGRVYFEACPEALMAVRDGRILQANGEMRRLLGLRSDSEIEGRRLEEIIPMDLDNRGGLYSALGRLLPGDVRSYEWELMIPGAVYIPVVIKATGLGGGVLLISVRDFTEGRERSMALLELEEQRRALLEATIFPVFCVDREYRILWCSSSFGSLVGERPGSVTGKPCHMILSGVDSSCPGCPAARAMRSKSTISISSCGSGNRFRASVSAFRGADGSPSGAVVMILDPPGGADSAPDGESSVKRGNDPRRIGACSGRCGRLARRGSRASRNPYMQESISRNGWTPRWSAWCRSSAMTSWSRQRMNPPGSG